MASYRAPAACLAAGVTYRQLDYWARTGMVVPSVAAAGSGTQRLYSAKDVVVLSVVARFLDLGVSLAQIRKLVDHFAKSDLDDLAGVTVVSDRHGVWDATVGLFSEILRGGLPFFAINVDAVVVEVRAALAAMDESPAA